MTAEAFASIDIAPIFAFIFLRSRRTRDRLADRLGKVAARLALDRDHDREEIGFGHRNALRHALDGFRQREPESGLHDLRGIRPRTGSSHSSAAMRIVSPSGRPDLTPRTMMSIAVGKLAMNFAIRRRRSHLSTNCGRPAPPITATSAATTRLPDWTQAAAPITSPAIAHATRNCDGLTERPACSIRLRRLARRRFAFSRSRRPSAICLRR